MDGSARGLGGSKHLDMGCDCFWRSLWFGLPPVYRPFFPPLDFKIKKKKKNLKKELKKKDLHRKETYFQNADTLLQSSGIGQCCPPSAIIVDSVNYSPLVTVMRLCVTVLHMPDALSGKPGLPRAAPHHFMYF